MFAGHLKSLPGHNHGFSISFYFWNGGFRGGKILSLMVGYWGDLARGGA